MTSKTKTSSNSLEISLLKKSLAEGLGTFFLVFMGCGAAVINAHQGDTLGIVGVAFAFGISGACAIYIAGGISGGHINPAVTLGALISGNISLRNSFFYWISQFVGAIIAIWLLSIFFTSGGINVEFALVPPPLIGSVEGFIFEAIAVFFLVMVVHAVINNNFYGFGAMAIGLAIFIGILVAGSISGGSLNPARALAPAIVTAQFSGWWTSLMAPFVGGALAGVVHLVGKNIR